MNAYLILPALAFALACLVPELLRPKLDAGHEPISTYLTGRYAWIERAGFVVLAVALLSFALNLGWLAAACAALSSAGILGAMLTKTDFARSGRWHLRSAQAAFIGAFALQLTASHGVALWILTALTPAGVGALYGWRPHATAWQEKAAAACLCAWLIGYGAIG